MSLARIRKPALIVVSLLLALTVLSLAPQPTALAPGGNGIVIAVLAVILSLAGDHLLANGLGLGALTLWLVVELAKALEHRGRPFIRLTQARIVGPRAIGRSFPSGRTSQAFFMATLLAGYFHAGVWMVWVFHDIALLVGITRMYVGAHCPAGRAGGGHPGQRLGPAGGIVFGFGLIRIG